jgi:hypothetical protein
LHSYSTTTAERQRIPTVFFATSILLAGCIHAVLSHYDVKLSWWVSFPSIGAIYACLFSLFDRLLWKWEPIRALLQVKIPVLQGQWTGLVQPASGEKTETRPATLTIDQHWSTINITLTTDRSESRSTMASIADERTSRPCLQYVYNNEPRESAVETMHRHPGTARLTLEQENGEAVLAGGYYTGRDRASTGELEFRRAQSDKSS